MGENIYDKGLISKHRRNSYNSIAKKKKKKLMGKEPEKTFLKRRHTNGQEVHEKVLCISNHQRNTNQNHNIFIYLQWKQVRVFIPVRMAINQETRDNKCWQEYTERRLHLVHYWGECKLV